MYSHGIGGENTSS